MRLDDVRYAARCVAADDDAAAADRRRARPAGAAQAQPRSRGRSRLNRRVAIAIARVHALDRRRAFNRCGPQSDRLARALRRAGIAAHVEHGVFWPATPMSPWHRRWREIGHGEKFHYWVVCGTTVLDPTAAQFGYEPLVVAPIDDPRYCADGALHSVAL